MRFIKRIEEYGVFFESQYTKHRAMQHDDSRSPTKCKLCKMYDRLRYSISPVRFFAPIRDRLPMNRPMVGIRYCRIVNIRNWS